MIAAIVFAVLAVFCNAAREAFQSRYAVSVFAAMNWNWFLRGWKNKYRLPLVPPVLTVPDLRGWQWLNPKLLFKAIRIKYYQWFRIEYVEKFPLSATLFVFISDPNHLWQWLENNFRALAYAGFTWNLVGTDIGFWQWVLLIRAVEALIWGLFFNIVFLKNKANGIKSDGQIPDQRPD